MKEVFVAGVERGKISAILSNSSADNATEAIKKYKATFESSYGPATYVYAITRMTIAEALAEQEAFSRVRNANPQDFIGYFPQDINGGCYPKTETKSAVDTELKNEAEAEAIAEALLKELEDPLQETLMKVVKARVRKPKYAYQLVQEALKENKDGEYEHRAPTWIILAAHQRLLGTPAYVMGLRTSTPKDDERANDMAKAFTRVLSMCDSLMLRDHGVSRFIHLTRSENEAVFKQMLRKLR
jgi:DNA-directed RNA polymerase specialized sigma24 family protein